MTNVDIAASHDSQYSSGGNRQKQVIEKASPTHLPLPPKKRKGLVY